MLISTWLWTRVMDVMQNAFPRTHPLCMGQKCCTEIDSSGCRVRPCNGRERWALEFGWCFGSAAQHSHCWARHSDPTPARVWWKFRLGHKHHATSHQDGWDSHLSHAGPQGPPTPQISCPCSCACPSLGPSSTSRGAGALSEIRVGTQQLLLLSQSPSTYSVHNLTRCFSCVSAVSFQVDIFSWVCDAWPIPTSRTDQKLHVLWAGNLGFKVTGWSRLCPFLVLSPISFDCAPLLPFHGSCLWSAELSCTTRNPCSYLENISYSSLDVLQVVKRE